MVKRCKRPQCPATDEWIKKMWCIQTVDYYSAFKERETLPDAKTWMDLEDVVLSPISQHQGTSTV